MAKVSFKKPATKTLSVRMSKRAYTRLGRLRIRVAGARVLTLTRRPARIRRR